MSDTESFEDSGNEQSELDDKATGFPFTNEALLIPFRMQQVLVNWIFIIASVALILDIGALQDIFAEGPKTHFAELCNWFGVLSCLGWFTGFVLLAHWLHSVGATPMGLTGCYMKLIASCFFNLQPMTGTMNDPLLGGPAGLWWSNLTGILFFHFGNCVSCLDFYLHTPPGADKKKGWLYHGNLPITAMWIYQGATWFLVASNFLACSFDGASWAPLVKIPEPPVYICQFAGGFGLLFGSVVYTVWCDGFRNFSY
jgi:hypothetical protein